MFTRNVDQNNIAVANVVDNYWLWQSFVAVQYVVFQQLYIKLVGAIHGLTGSRPAPIPQRRTTTRTTASVFDFPSTSSSDQTSERKQMRKASTLIGLTLIALGAGARAEDQVPAAPAPSTVAVDPFPAAAIAAPVPESPPPPRRIKVGLSFLPMGIGRFTTPIGGTATEGDASFAYAFGLLATYRIIGGLELGIAPQLLYNVNYKVYPSIITAPPGSKETDLMGRVGYTFPVVETIGLYLAAMPGYSIIGQPGSPSAKGFVLALEGGVEMAVTDRIFAALGGGYQLGFQSVTVSGTKLDDRTRYVRVNLGGGFRF